MDTFSMNKKAACYARLCQNDGRKYCSACKYAYYCSVECQKKDWSSHKDFCLKNREIKEDKNQLQGLRFLHKLDNEMIQQMLAYLFYQVSLPIDIWGGIKLTINSEFTGKTMSYLELKKNSVPEPILKERMADVLNDIYSQRTTYRDDSLNSYDPKLFLFIISYKGFSILFSSTREDFQRKINKAREFGNKSR